MTTIQSKASAFAAVCLLLAAGATAAAPLYTLTDLGLIGNASSSATLAGINANGLLAGSASGSYNGLHHAFVQAGSTRTYLGSLEGLKAGYSDADDINIYGQVTGMSSSANSWRAFVYDGSKMVDIGALYVGSGVQQYSAGYAINDLGQVTGTSLAGTGSLHAIFYDGTTMKDLGTLSPGNIGESAGYDIANNGWITGKSGSGYNGVNTHAFLYDGQTMKDLGTLGGRTSIGYALNGVGQVVGESYVAGDTSFHAFLYTGAAMTDLGTLGGSGSSASAINSLGQVVGSADDAAGIRRAFLFDGGSMVDLNSVLDASGGGWTLTGGADIFDDGRIVGQGQMADGSRRAFMLTPVPEPATSALFLAGMVAAAVVCQRSKRT